MAVNNSNDYIDTVAQAVIDRIEEHGRLKSLVDIVVARVIELQNQEAQLKAEEAAKAVLAENPKGGQIVD